MSKTSELDIDMRNAVDVGMKEFEKVRFSANAEEGIRQTMQEIYSKAMITTANMIDQPEMQTLTVRKPVKIRPEVFFGIALCLLASLADYRDLNKVIFGFGIAFFYQPVLKCLITGFIGFAQWINKITTP